MSDQQLRNLERRFFESASLEDEVALLSLRSRAGALDPARLRLAARLGSQAAQEILGLGPPGQRPDLELLSRSLVGGREPTLRAFLAAADLAVSCADLEEDFCVTFLERAEDLFFAQRGSAKRAELEADLLARVTSPRLLDLQDATEQLMWLGTGLSEVAAWVVRHRSPGRDNTVLLGLAWSVKRVHYFNRVAVFRAVLKELMPWLLGHSDPLRERVEARRQRGRQGA